MKYLGLVFLAQASIAEWVEYTASGPIITDDDGTTESTDDPESFDRNFSLMGNMMEMVMCPPADPNRPAYCDDGFTLFSGKQQTFRQAINRLIAHHGCNCFPTNRRIPHPNPNIDRLIPAPGTNGAPVNSLDEACTVLAKRNRCLEIDNVNYREYLVESYSIFKDHT